MLQPLCKTGCSATAKWQMMFFPQACVTNSYPFATESKFTQFFKCRYVVYWKELLDILSFFLLRKEKELPCLLTLSAKVFSVLAWMCCSINISHFKEPFHVPHIFLFWRPMLNADLAETGFIQLTTCVAPWKYLGRVNKLSMHFHRCKI